MAKKINVDVNLRDEEAKKKLKDIENGKYKVDVDINSDGADKTTKKISELAYTTKHSQTVFEKLKNTMGNLFSGKNIAFTAYLAVLNEIRKAASNTRQEITDLDKSITDLSVAMGQGRNAAAEYLKQLNQQAQDMGATTKEVADSADSWLRQGKSVKETGELVYDSMILSKLGQIESADASTYLTSALNGYKKSASEAINIVDKLTAVDMESASDAGGLAESMSKTASAADMAGVSMDKLIGMIATVKEVTQDSDESVGNMFKSVFSRMNQIKAGKFVDLENGESLNDTEKVLNKVGIAMRNANGQFISSEKIMDEVGEKWSDFDSVTQRAVATAMAGSYQYNKLIALFNNYSKALDYTKTSAESAGTAIEKFNSSYKESLEAKTNTLQASFESMIMNSDMNEVYSSILDATTALVKFVDETKILKGALIGVAAFAGIKAFMSIKTGATEAYIELNKFTNAVKIANSTEISTAEYNKLLLLSDGLSKKQMKLILTTNSLTVAQKKQLLMSSGLSKEEAIATLQAWKMSVANNGLSASTTSVSNAFKGLWLTLKANPLILITSAIAIGVSAWQKYKQAQEEASQKASEAANTYKEQSSSIDDAVTKYKELHQQLLAAKGNEEETASVKSQLLDLQKQLNEQFGEEYGNINLVTDAYKDHTEAIKAYNKEAANTLLNENRTELNRAEDKMTDDNVYMLGNLDGLTKADELGTLDKIKKFAADNNIQFSDMGGFQFTGNAEEATEAINNFMTSVSNLQKELESTGETSDVLDNIFEGLLDNSSEALTDANSIIDEYGEKYQEKQLAEIASSDKLSSAYSKVTSAVQKYNDAVANSDNPYEDENVKSAYDNLQKIKGEISDDSDWDNYKDIIDKTFDEADSDSYAFYEDLKENKDGIGDLADELKGLSETDIQSMIDDGDNGDAFDKLVNSAKEFGLEAQDVISILKSLGIILDDVSDDGQKSLAKTKSEMIDTINDMSDGFDILDKVYKDVKDGDVFDFTNLNTKKFQEAFSGLEPEYEKFIETVSASPNDLKGCQDAFNELASAWINSKGILEGLTEENANVAESMLKNMGISNAEEIIQGYLGVIKEVTNAGYDLESITEDEAVAFLNQAKASDTAKQYLTNYLIQKQLSQQPLNTSSDVLALENLCDKLGVTGEMYKYVTGLKSTLAAVDAGAPLAAYQSQIDSYKEKIANLSSTGTINFKFNYTGGDSSNKTSKSKSSSSSKDAYKTAFEKEYNLLKHNLEMGYITEEQYYNGVQTLNEKYFVGKEKYLDEYRKYEEEVYKGLKAYYKSYCDNMMDYYEKSLDANKISYKEYCDAVSKMLADMHNSGKISDKDWYDYTQTMLNKQKDLYDRALSAITRRLEKEIDAWQSKIDELNDQNDSLNDQKDDMDSAIDAITRVYDTEIDRIQGIIDGLKDANDECERTIALEKAKYELERAYSKRVKKIYTEEKGYIYELDYDKVRDAQKTYDDAELDVKTNELQKQIDTLEEFKQKWQDIQDAYQKSIDEMNATALLGSEYQKLILNNNIVDIENFKNRYLKIQSQINDNEELIKSFEEKKDYYEKLKDQWSSISDEYSNSVDDMYAKQLLGADWESQVLSGRIDTLDDFRNKYNDIQKAISDMAWQSANAQISALNAIKAAEENVSQTSGGTGGSGGSSGGGGGFTPIQNQKAYHVLHLVGGYSTSGEASSKISSFNGKGVYKYKDGKWYVYKEEDYSNLSFGSKSEADDYIKKHLSPAGRFLVKYYHDGLENGLVDFSKKDSNFDLVQKYGLKKYEVPAILKQGEAVMNQEQIKNLGEALRSIPTAATLRTVPDYTKMLSSLKTNNNPVMVTQSVNITLPNVTNNSGYENLTRELNRLKLDAYQFANRRN